MAPITFEMITRVLVRPSPLHLPVRGLLRCPPHAREGRRSGTFCQMNRTRCSMTTHILDPCGIIEIQNPEFTCGNLQSVKFYAFGGSGTAVFHPRNREYPYVEVPSWNGDTTQKAVYSVNKACGVTKHYLNWCSNMGSVAPSSWNMGTSYLCLIYDCILTAI